MPRRPKHPCRHRGCAALVDAPGYCSSHASEASNWAEHIARRGSRHERGYGTKWDRLRASILARDCGLCQACQRAGFVTAATHVDHITPKAQGGTDDPGNLEALCAPCHRRKTAGEGGRKV